MTPMETLLKIDFASFQNFSPEYQATQLPKSREIRWELKGENRFRVQIYRLAVPVLSSTKTLWSFYVVLAQGRQRKLQKSATGLPITLRSYLCCNQGADDQSD